jgi:hypothetical protein
LEIRGIEVLSLAKMLGAIYLVLGLLFGIVFALVSTLAGIAGSATADEGRMLGFLFGIGAVIVLPVFYGAIGFVGGVLIAALYNLFAGLVGGIRLTVTTTELR